MAEFGRLCATPENPKGVSRAGITLAVQRGNLVRTTDGKIDDADPVNAAYLAGKTGPVVKQVPKGESLGKQLAKLQAKKTAPVDKPKRAPRTKKSDAPPPPPVDAGAEPSPPVDDADPLPADAPAELILRKLKADIAYKEAATARYDLEMEIKKGNLVERAQMVAVIQGMNKAVSDHLHQLWPKLGPMVYATARKDGASELDVTRLCETMGGEATRRAVEDFTRAG